MTNPEGKPWEPVWSSYEWNDGVHGRGFPWDKESVEDVRTSIANAFLVACHITLANGQRIIVRAKR